LYGHVGAQVSLTSCFGPSPDHCAVYGLWLDWTVLAVACSPAHMGHMCTDFASLQLYLDHIPEHTVSSLARNRLSRFAHMTLTLAPALMQLHQYMFYLRQSNSVGAEVSVLLGNRTSMKMKITETPHQTLCDLDGGTDIQTFCFAPGCSPFIRCP
jgi:hypothetical protein